MKLLRYGPAGHEKPGVLLDGQRYDVAAFGEDYHEQFFATDGPTRLAAFVQAQAGQLPAVADAERLGPPIARPSKIVCVGLNYSDHADEMGLAHPAEPVCRVPSPPVGAPAAAASQKLSGGGAGQGSASAGSMSRKPSTAANAWSGLTM